MASPSSRLLLEPTAVDDPGSVDLIDLLQDGAKRGVEHGHKSEPGESEARLTQAGEGVRSAAPRLS